LGAAEITLGAFKCTVASKKFWSSISIKNLFRF
jgi:hypothetical protein